MIYILYDYEKPMLPATMMISNSKGLLNQSFPTLTLELSETSKIKSMVTHYRKPENHIIHFKNGLLDTKTFIFTDHDPGKFVKKIIPYEYNENSYSKFFEE